MGSSKNLSYAERIVRNRKRGLAIIIIASMALGFIMFSSFSKAEASRPSFTYYDSYEIKAGDTLWTIADQYMDGENFDKERFVDTIKRNNHLLDSEIHAGDYLIIEYKSCERL